MLYTKNDEQRYVDMCAEFDRLFPITPRDDVKLFRIMYLVFYMLACKENFFNRNFDYYDEYAQFAATVIYTRFLKKLNHGEKIKSLLNYAKSSQRFLKIMFQNESFEELINPEKGINTQDITENLRSAVRSDYRDESLVDDVKVSLSRVGDVLKDIVDELSFDELTKHRLYISSLLTLLNSVTLPRALKSQLERRKVIDDNVVLEAYAREREESPILWNLNDSMKNMVKVIVNRTRSELSADLNETIKEHTIPDDVVDLILADVYREALLIEEKEEDYD